MKPLVEFGMAQFQGARREQQDTIGVFPDVGDKSPSATGVLAIVADGVGGHAHGGEASRLSVASFVEDYRAKPLQASTPDALYHALMESNQAVLDFAEGRHEPENCGSTLVAAALLPEVASLHWIAVGDSRLYLWRQAELAQFTADANYAGHLIKKVARGMMSREECANWENLHRLTSFVGMKKLGKFDRTLRPFRLHHGDMALLCTDGVFQALGEAGMARLLTGEAQSDCNRIIQAIKDMNLNYQDNASLIVLRYIAPGNADAGPPPTGHLKPTGGTNPASQPTPAVFKARTVSASGAAHKTNAMRISARGARQDPPLHWAGSYGKPSKPYFLITAIVLVVLLATIWLAYRVEQSQPRDDAGVAEMPPPPGNAR